MRLQKNYLFLSKREKRDEQQKKWTHFKRKVQSAYAKMTWAQSNKNHTIVVLFYNEVCNTLVVKKVENYLLIFN